MRGRFSAATATSAATPSIDDGRRARRQDRRHRLQPAMSIIQRHRDLQSVRRARPLPARSERGGGAGDRPRRSSPISKRGAHRRVARHAAVVAVGRRRVHRGRHAQGADVVDYGMMATDMLYFAVARDGHDGGVQITASHNPEAVQRHQDGAARGVSAERRGGLGEIRDMIDGRHAAGAGRDAAAACRRRTWSTTTSST